MSKSKAQSGLGTIKRDWSETSATQTLSSSQDIPWPPTPPQPAATPKLTGAQQRLKDIEDALAGLPPSTSEPNGNNKRPTAGAAPAAPPAKKARQLPASWSDPLATKSLDARALTEPAIRKHLSASTPTSTDAKTAAKAKVAPVFLSQEQTQILKLVQDGDSVFYTGSAGTGKSVLLREIIKALRKKYVKAPDSVAITASTGIAACNIGGVTIHSFAGIGLGVESADELATKIRKNKKASSRWQRTRVLIIDEVSMIDGDLFDKLTKIGSILRRKPEPFGGIQIIVTGDFFQLPPVTKGGMEVKFAFEATLWNTTIKRTFNLTKVFRQRDQEFVDMLNEMRFGRLSNKSIAKFKSLSREIAYEDGLEATELFPRREDVNRANATRISRLSTQTETYRALDGGTIPPGDQRDKMLANFMAPENLVLRLDAQVMLTKNVDETLVNGSMGKVLNFVDPATVNVEVNSADGNVKSTNPGTSTSNIKKASANVGKPILYPVVEFVLSNGGKRTVLVIPELWKVELPSGEIQASRLQLPLILAWAMSIHKSQGQTLDRVKVDLGKVFEKGQAYVALSRATSLEGLRVLNFHPSKVNAHPKVAEWSKTLETVSE